ncbi:MAG: HypC/HybG/HupF family hydrogenase formation chaperone [Bryobacteraceae bacterium]|nr:HypC/HybG/HupF family hydrogenase formation chaperone [Bryobacteraceae bacterium]
MCLAIPGKVVHINGTDPTLRRAQVDFSGIRKEVSLAFTPEAVEGSYVLVHVGFAINVIDELEAERTLEELRKLGEVEPL